jgi:hypothetical protein
MEQAAEFSDLIGKIISKIDNSGDELVFHTDAGTYRMFHDQDCCENVRIEDINGDLEDLLNTPVLHATEECGNTDPADYKANSDWRDSFTWTFYRISTIKGTVVIRWLGESNGYYSESVCLKRQVG